MEHILEENLKHNDPPPEEIVPSATDLLIAARRKLQEMRNERDRLSKLVDEAYTKMTDIHNSFQDLKIIESPARRLLPSNILRRIFHHCLPTHRNPSMSSDEAPMLLTSVCSTWRSVALEYPHIWSSIYINFTYSPPDMGGGSNFTDVEKIMEVRSDAVKTWLSRSGSCPLSLSIRHADKQGWLDDDMQIQPREATTQKLFEIVASLSHRWEDIELIMKSEVYFKFEAMMSADRLPALKYVRLALDPQRHRYDDDTYPILLLSKTPNLRVLALNWWNWCPPMPASWSGLAYFSCHSDVSIMNAFALLLSCPSLIHCRLSLSHFIHPMDVLQFDGIATLPQLRSLSIAGSLATRRATSEFLDHIDAPKLIQIKYHHPPDYHYVDDGHDTTASFPWLSLFRVSIIQKLTVDPRVFLGTSNELIEVLRISTGLTELVIGQESELAPNTIYHYAPRYRPLKNFDYLALFDLLTVDSEASTPAKEIFLPNLEVFQVFVNSTVSQETVYRFVTSRMVPSSTYGVRVLKRVNIVLETTDRQRDLEAELNQYGEQVGVRLQVYIDHQYDYYESNNRFSPGYGLTPDGDRSWLYEHDVSD